VLFIRPGYADQRALNNKHRRAATARYTLRCLTRLSTEDTLFIYCPAELIPVIGSQPAGGVSHKPGGRLPLLAARPAVTPQPLRRLLPILLLGEQRNDGCEQFA